MTGPVAVSAQGINPKPSDRQLEMALAIIASLIPHEIVLRLAAQVESVRDLRTHGGVDVKLNTYDGRVESADFAMRSHWRVPMARKKI